MKPENFKSALIHLGWSQAEFARRTGVDATTISRWMQGHSPLPKWAAEYMRVMILAREILG